MSSFNLAQIVPALESGGVERGTIDLSNYLSSKNLFNHIISSGGNLLNEINREFTSHCLLPVNSKNFLQYPIIANAVSKYIKENKINILHVRSRAPAWIISMISKKNIQTVSTFHNIYGGESFIKKFYNKQMTKVNHVIAISNYVKSNIVKKYNLEPDKITVINRGIDTDFFNDNVDENEKKDFLKQFNIKQNSKIILYPGRITEWKGQIEFLRSVESLNVKNFVVLFVGSTINLSQTNLLKKTINEKNLIHKCRVIGSLNYNQLKVAYSVSDLVISMPKRGEGFGRTISEALSMKKMILAKYVGGAYDQLNQLDDVFKIDEKELNDLSHQIKNCFEIPKETKKNILVNARQHIVDNFSMQNMVLNYFNFYERISN